MKKKFFIIVFLSLPIIADSSFDTIPDIKIDNINKYNLGKKLFHDKNLSKDIYVNESLNVLNDLRLSYVER